jgi:aspartyl-tRNA synthetase
MDKYGVDRPDMRIPLEIIGIDEPQICINDWLK